jgi:large subunit ribosomal protein L10
MNADKNIIIEDILRKLNASPFLLVIDYGGLTVGQFNELRHRLAKAGAECYVAKNSYVKRAAAAAEFPDGLGAQLVGQSAIVTGDSEVVAAAKVLKNFHAEFTRPRMKGGVLDGNLIDEAGVKALADLPSREELLAKVLGLLNQPASMLVRLLNEPAASLARVLKAKADLG